MADELTGPEVPEAPEVEGPPPEGPPPCTLLPLLPHRANRPSRKRAWDALKVLEMYLLDGNALDDSIRDRINAIISENNNRLRLLIHGLARTKAEELITIGQDIDTGLDILSSRIPTMGNEDLIKTMQLLNGRDKDLSHFLVEAMKIPDPSKVDKPGEKILDRLKDVGITNIPTMSERRKVVDVLDKVIREAAKRNLPTDKEKSDS